MTLSELLAAYVDRARARRKPRTVAIYAAAVERIVKLHGERQADAIGEPELDAYRAHRLAAGVSHATVDLEEGIYRAALRHAGVGPSGPRPRRSSRRAPPKYIPAPDVARLIDTMRDSDRFRRLTPFVHLAAYAGLRISETQSLRWVDVDLRRRELHVRAYKSGTIGAFDPKSCARVVMFDDQLRETLTTWHEYLQHMVVRDTRSANFVGRMAGPLELVAPHIWPRPTDTEWVGNGHRRWPRSSLHRVVGQLFDFADVAQGVDVRHRVHALRGTYATNLGRAGVDIATIASLLGHASIGTTSRYVETDEDTKRAAVVRLRGPGRADLAREYFGEPAESRVESG